MRSRSRVVALLAGLIFSITTLVYAQTGTASLRGTVTDSSGAIVSNAKVTLTNKERGFERTIMSGSAGGYEFLQVPPGTYQIDVEMAGFQRHEQTGVQLLVDNPVTINVKLSIGAATEIIEVTVQGAVINTSDVSLGNAFDEH